MSIQNVANKIKVYTDNDHLYWFFVAFWVVIGLSGSFFLYEVGQGSGMRVFQDPSLSKGGLVLASSKSRAYFYPWCRQGQTLKGVDRVEFYSIESAKAAGYKASKQCAGLW